MEHSPGLDGRRSLISQVGLRVTTSYVAQGRRPQSLGRLIPRSQAPPAAESFAFSGRAHSPFQAMIFLSESWAFRGSRGVSREPEGGDFDGYNLG